MKANELYPSVFSRHAAAYARRVDQIMARGEARGRQRVIDLVAARPGMRILDLACGPGNLTARLAALVAPRGEVVGVDLAPGMIAVARDRELPNARFEVMDIEALAFGDGSFDGATCGHGMQFVPHLDRALSESRRVLKRGARFAASIPVDGPAEDARQLLDRLLDRHLPPAPTPVDQGVTRRTVSDPRLFAGAALKGGFNSADVEQIDETVVWPSADEFVAQITGWWACATRLEGVDEQRQQAFVTEATQALRREHPGAIETTARNLVLYAVA